MSRERDEVIANLSSRRTAAELLASLACEGDEQTEAAWAAEIEQRARRVLAGEGEFEDWEKIREQLRPGS